MASGFRSQSSRVAIVNKLLLETRDAHELYARYGLEHVEAMKRPPVVGT